MKVKNLDLPGRYNDGGGLLLQVRSASARSWLFRYTFAGKAHWLGLGDADLVSLAEARVKALEHRKALLEGRDPLATKRNNEAVARTARNERTFDVVSGEFIAAHRASWKNEKHASQWISTLATYASPIFGNKVISTIVTEDILSVLAPIWTAKPETANRVRGRLENVLAYAAARHWRPQFNPAAWPHLKSLLPAQAKVNRVKHHVALPYRDVPAFISTLSVHDSVSARALQFLILTAARTGEVLGAKWSEVDLVTMVWNVPGDRMKAGKEHRVPLSLQAVDLLEKIRPLKKAHHDSYLFSGAKMEKPLSNMAMLMLVRGTAWSGVTVHGFRSAFRDWVSEETGFQKEVAEAALAHTIESKVEAAYRRGDLLEKRKNMMQMWGTFCFATMQSDFIGSKRAE